METLDLVELLKLSEEDFRRQFRHSPIRRAKLTGLQRNACVVLGNKKDKSAVAALVEALNAGESIVRSHAAWALGQIQSDGARQALIEAQGYENDPDVLEEIQAALAC